MQDGIVLVVDAQIWHREIFAGNQDGRPVTGRMFERGVAEICWRKAAVVVIYIKHDDVTNLPKVRETHRRTALLADGNHHRDEDAHEQGDDAQDDQQLDDAKGVSPRAADLAQALAW